MINKQLGLMALLAGCVAGNIVAGDFNNYAVGDVLVCFRNGGANDLVVDAGPVSTLVNASPNQVIPIGQYTTAQIDAAFGSADGVDWSAFTWGSDNTLYATQARVSLNTQSAPFQRKSSTSQAYVAQRMNAIQLGATNNIADNGLNTAMAVIEPDSSSGYSFGALSYKDSLSGAYGGRFNGTFSGNPENVTPGDFTTSGTVLRSDFYQLTPVSGFGFGTFLGYFEMATDGTLTYVAYPGTVPTIPVIHSISRSSTVSTITYTTGLSGTYTLRGNTTLNSGLAMTNWPAIATLPDAATVQTYQDTDSSDIKFYIITAQ
jgi:hypothetical protein